MVEAGDIDGLGAILHQGWEAKRKLAQGVSSSELDEIYERAVKAGALGGKISGEETATRMPTSPRQFDRPKPACRRNRKWNRLRVITLAIRLAAQEQRRKMSGTQINWQSFSSRARATSSGGPDPNHRTFLSLFDCVRISMRV